MAKVDARTQRLLKEVGDLIRTTREAQNVSQYEMARRVGMTRSSYARIEHGRSNVTIDSVRRIADGLGVRLRIDRLFDVDARKT